MIWIELLGPSGIGKSFIYQELLKQKIVLPIELCPYHPNKFVAHNKWCRFLLIRKFYRDFHKYIPIYNELDLMTQTVFKDGLVFYSDNQRARKSLEDYYLYKFKEFKFLQEKLKQNDIFFSEDGILHLNYGINEDNVHQILLPHVVIHLKASEDFVHNNRLKRIREKKSNMIEKEIPDEELPGVFSKNYLRYNQKMELLKKHYKNNFFEINVEENGIEAIIAKVQDIIKWAKK